MGETLERQKWLREQGRQRKLALIKLMGGGCERCGYNESSAALEFHHIDSDTKEFHVGTKLPRGSWDRILAEVAKCQLLCANCHRMLRFEREEESV